MTTTITRTAMRDPIERLWHLHATTVRRWLRSRCGCPSTVDDVLAETFADAARAVGRGTSVEVGWLMVVARRRLADHWRRQSLSERTSEALRAERPSVHGSTLQLVDDDVIAALMTLPLRQRRALVLRYLNDMTVGQTAEALGVSYRATESLLSRARSNMARAYSAQRSLLVGGAPHSS